MPSLRDAVETVAHLGPGWVFRRARYAMGRRLGLVRQSTPAVAWESLRAPTVRVARLLIAAPEWDFAAVRQEAEAILAGKFRLFSDATVAAGFLPDWHRNQITEDSGQRTEDRGQSDIKHWTKISDFGGGDIKGVWELSRFPWAFPLARAYAHLNDPKFAAAFWRLFGDWCEKNPPNLGPNWMCGQEATFRLMAVAFACGVLGVPDDERERLARFVVATGRRIAGNLDYALNQQNNHGVSECVGLITAGLLLPEHDESGPWLRRALAALERQLAELVYADGGFSQHSLIYHRVLLHDLCWVRHRLAAAGLEAPAWLDATGKRATDFLAVLIEPLTGAAPLYGTNDGANVLPLADGEFTDCRPAVQLASALFHRALRYAPGPWDEAAAWLVPEWKSLPRSEDGLPARWHATDAGIFQLVRGRDRLVMRCPTRFRHRPAQADMLHVDVWLDGRAVAADGGSFSYNSGERFTALAAAREHNVLTIDGVEPMRKASRFLYLPWSTGTAAATEGGGLAASHDGFRTHGVAWAREVRPRRGGGFVVIDRVTGAAGKRLRWHWRLADWDWHLNPEGNEITAANGPDGGTRAVVRWTGVGVSTSKLIRVDPASASGWRSVRYGAVEPAGALVILADNQDAVEFVTEFFSAT